MASPTQLKNFFLGTGDSIAGGRAIKDLPQASEHLAALAHTPSQRAALLKFDEQIKIWRAELQTTVKT